MLSNLLFWIGLPALFVAGVAAVIFLPGVATTLWTVLSTQAGRIATLCAASLALGWFVAARMDAGALREARAACDAKLAQVDADNRRLQAEAERSVRASEVENRKQIEAALERAESSKAVLLAQTAELHRKLAAVAAEVDKRGVDPILMDIIRGGRK